MIKMNSRAQLNGRTVFFFFFKMVSCLSLAVTWNSKTSVQNSTEMAINQINSLLGNKLKIFVQIFSSSLCWCCCCCCCFWFVAIVVVEYNACEVLLYHQPPQESGAIYLYYASSGIWNKDRVILKLATKDISAPWIKACVLIFIGNAPRKKR